MTASLCPSEISRPYATTCEIKRGRSVGGIPHCVQFFETCRDISLVFIFRFFLPGHFLALFLNLTENINFLVLGKLHILTCSYRKKSFPREKDKGGFFAVNSTIAFS